MPTPTAWTTEAAAILEREQKMSSKTSGEGRTPVTAEGHHASNCKVQRDPCPCGFDSAYRPEMMEAVEDQVRMLSVRGPRYLRDMSVMEQRWSEAWHELQCDDDPKGHPLSDHEPFDVDESDFSWQEMVEALRRHGIAIEAEAADLRVLEAEGLARPDAAALADYLREVGDYEADTATFVFDGNANPEGFAAAILARLPAAPADDPEPADPSDEMEWVHRLLNLVPEAQYRQGLAIVDRIKAKRSAAAEGDDHD